MSLYKNLICLLFSFVSCTGYAQVEVILLHNDSLKQSSITALNTISYPASGKAKVHPFYINTDFAHSYVIDQFDNIIYFSGRYNVLKKSIEAKLGEGLRIIKLNKVQLAQVGRTTLVPIPRQQRPQVDNNSYVEVLSSGKIYLLRSHLMASKMELGGSLSMQADGKKVYYTDEKLYYTTDFQTFTLLKKKKILGLFGAAQTQVKNFISENDLKLNDVEDLVKIFDFYHDK